MVGFKGQSDSDDSQDEVQYDSPQGSRLEHDNSVPILPQVHSKKASATNLNAIS